LEVLVAAPGEVTALLAKVRNGDQDALAELTPLVYREMRRLAGHFMRDERAGHTLQPTEVVHEAYLCLVGQDHANWQNRAQFMAIAAQIMRRILLQYARRRRAAKREMPPPEELPTPALAGNWEEILAVDEALSRLGELSPQQARIAELRYFGGLSVEEAAESLGISPRTVKREWAMAKGWLHAELSGEGIR
jgi:RNA polymerase sigma factor (TIGR02999 family)